MMVIKIYSSLLRIVIDNNENMEYEEETRRKPANILRVHGRYRYLHQLGRDNSEQLRTKSPDRDKE